jgi:hypothetical protein
MKSRSASSTLDYLANFPVCFLAKLIKCSLEVILVEMNVCRPPVSALPLLTPSLSLSLFSLFLDGLKV